MFQTLFAVSWLLAKNSREKAMKEQLRLKYRGRSFGPTEGLRMTKLRSVSDVDRKRRPNGRPSQFEPLAKPR